METYIVESEATVVEIDGQKWTVVLLAFDYGSPKAKRLVSDEVWRWIGKNNRLITAMRHGDGTLGFVASSELQKKLHAAIRPGHKWTRIRLYPPGDGLSESGSPG
jgi:hypothetical protein